MAAPIASPQAPRVMAIVQAGGKGSRMGVLTQHRAKPALPVGGTHQLIDVALSNLANSGISTVWVSVQYQAGTLDKHLQHGRPWDLDRNHGGFRRVVPEETDEKFAGGFSTGNADDLYRLRHEIAAEDTDVVVVLSADQVFALDLRPVVMEHIEKGSDATIVTTDVTRADAKNKAVVRVDATGRVTRIDEKPDDPFGTTISAEVVIYSKDALLEALQEAFENADGDDDDSGLGDFAEKLLPTLIERGRVRTHALPGYWRDMGRPVSYLAAHQDLAGGKIGLFADEAWPMRTLSADRGAARLRQGAVIEDSLISPGCDVAGTVRRSTLGPGVVVRAGAVVEDSVLFDGVVVEKDARVHTAIVDVDVAIRQAATVGAAPNGRMGDDDVTVVGAGATIRGQVKAGTQVEPDKAID